MLHATYLVLTTAATSLAATSLAAAIDWQFAIVVVIVALAARQVARQFVRTWTSSRGCQGCSSKGCQPADNLVSIELPARRRTGFQPVQNEIDKRTG